MSDANSEPNAPADAPEGTPRALAHEQFSFSNDSAWSAATARQSGRLLQMLTEAQSAMARLFERRAKHLGLNRPQWRVLSGLIGRNGITQTELADRVAIARSPLGKIIDQLERRGLVERRDDAHDRRINRLYLTDAVTPLVAPATRLAMELESAVLQPLPEEAEFLDQLAAVTEHLQEIVQREFHTHSAG